MNNELVNFCLFVHTRQDKLKYDNCQMAEYLGISELQYLGLKSGYIDIENDIILHKIASKLDIRFTELKSRSKHTKSKYKVSPTEGDVSQGFEMSDFMKKKGNLSFCKFLERKQEDLKLTNAQMADKLYMPVLMYLGFKNGYLEPPSQKLLYQIAENLGMGADELRPIAEKKSW